METLQNQQSQNLLSKKRESMKLSFTLKQDGFKSKSETLVLTKKDNTKLSFFTKELYVRKNKNLQNESSDTNNSRLHNES
jgi:hypothetical protein